MSKFIDKLNRLSRTESQSIGFRTEQPTPPKPKLQLIASLAQENAEQLTAHVAGADAGLLRISKSAAGAKILEKMAQSVPDIPWGGWLSGGRGNIKQLRKANCDFVVFPANNTPLTTLENNEAGKILAVESSLSEGLLRTVNDLPVDAVLIVSEQSEVFSLTWQHLMLFRRFADLLTKPLLASIPAKVTATELQTLWEVGINGVVTEVTAGQPQDRLQELRQVIDKLEFPSSRQWKRAEPLVPRIGLETRTAVSEEEDEEE